jgi:hypothetical protein
MAVPGTWFGLPDFGITERLTGGQWGGTALNNPSIASPGNILSPTSVPNPSGQMGTTGNPIPGTFSSTPGGQVAGASTGGGGGGGGSNLNLRQQMEQGVIPWDDNLLNAGSSGGGIDTGEATNAINQGYDAYFASLNQIMNSYLPQQQQALLGGAEAQYGQGVNSLNTQRSLQQQGLNEQKGVVQGQQKKTLADISNNLRNAYMAGNIYLGARGAGDSSAANQYSYALTKLGSQQRGDVSGQYAGIQNQIMGRENALATTYSGAVKDLEFQKNQRVNEVAQWFNEQQIALKQAQASGQLQKGQDLANLSQNLLQMAMQQLQTTQAEIANKRGMLDEWAMNNSTTIEGLKSNLQQVGSQVSYQNPTAQPFGSINQQTGSLGYIPYGLGSTTEEKKTTS